MPAYSININDFSSNYTLIGIHTTLEDYYLAFLFNKHLKTTFKRTKYNLDFKNKNYNSSYSIYEYTNKTSNDEWFLIANTCKTKIAFTGLFNESETTTYLIPENKKVDFLLKIERGYNQKFVEKLIENINQIPQIITSYIIEIETLKSKESLIF